MKMIGAGLMAAMLAMAGVSSHAASAMGAEAGKAIVATASAEAGAVKSAEAVKQAPRRVSMTPEQRAEMRTRREKFMAERKAAMEKKMLDVVKKYVPDEEKAKALVAELQETMMSARRAAANRPRPSAKKAE